MKNFPERLEDFNKEVTEFIKQKTLNILTNKDMYIKFDEEFNITEGIVLGISIDKDNEISIVFEEEMGETNFISIDFLSVDDLVFIADELQGSRISLELLDSI